MRIFASTLLLVFAIFSLPLQARPVLVLAADSWCPYNCDAEAQNPGYLVEFAKLVATKNGYDLDYRVLPWSRALELARQGKIQGVIGATPVNGSALTLGSEAVGLDTTVAAVRPNLISLPKLSDDYSPLDGLRLGFIQNYTYDNGGIIDRYVLSRRLNKPDTVSMVSGANGLEELLVSMSHQQIDMLFENDAVLRHALKDKPQPLTIIPTEAVGKLYFGFSPNDDGRGWAAVFDSALRQAKADGSLAAIMAKYGLQPWWQEVSPAKP